MAGDRKNEAAISGLQCDCISKSMVLILISCFTLHLKVLSISSLLFQEYEQSLEILRKTYFANATNIDTIRQANFEYLSDAVIRDNMLQIVMLQANANSNSTDNRKRRNTFFLK